MVILCGAELGKAMPIAPSSAADLKQQTRVKREKYLTRFRTWLWEEKGVSFKFLVEEKPADPERVASLWWSMGSSCTTLEQPMEYTQKQSMRLQVRGPWPYDHNPAMPLSVVSAMAVVALTWGKLAPLGSSVDCQLGWVMRIGEVLSDSIGRNWCSRWVVRQGPPSPGDDTHAEDRGLGCKPPSSSY